MVIDKNSFQFTFICWKNLEEIGEVCYGGIRGCDRFSNKTTKSLVTSLFQFNKIKHRQVHSSFIFANCDKHLYRSHSIFLTTRNTGRVYLFVYDFKINSNSLDCKEGLAKKKFVCLSVCRFSCGGQRNIEIQSFAKTLF